MFCVFLILCRNRFKISTRNRYTKSKQAKCSPRKINIQTRSKSRFIVCQMQTKIRSVNLKISKNHHHRLQYTNKLSLSLSLYFSVSVSVTTSQNDNKRRPLRQRHCKYISLLQSFSFAWAHLKLLLFDVRRTKKNTYCQCRISCSHTNTH